MRIDNYFYHQNSIFQEVYKLFVDNNNNNNKKLLNYFYKILGINILSIRGIDNYVFF